MKHPYLLHGKHAAGRSLAVLTAMTLMLTLTACMPGVYLRTEEIAAADQKGAYTLFLYGCGVPDRIENLAVLAREGGTHEFGLYAPAFEYKVRKGLALEEALAEAETFIRCSSHYHKSQLSRILDPAGTVIGYELRPLYLPFEFGRSDVLWVRYKASGNKVVVFIDLDLVVERALSERDGPFDSEGGAGNGFPGK